MANAQLNVKFPTNGRGGQNLALHGYIYRVNRRGPHKVFWRCTIPECSATVSTENNIPVGFGRQQHNHPADHTQIVAKHIMNLVTERCAKEVKPIPSIYSEELNRLRGNEWDDTSREVVSNLLMQSPLLSSHLYWKITFFLSCHRQFHMNWTFIKRSAVLKSHFFFAPKVTS